MFAEMKDAIDSGITGVAGTIAAVASDQSDMAASVAALASDQSDTVSRQDALLKTVESNAAVAKSDHENVTTRAAESVEDFITLNGTVFTFLAEYASYTAAQEACEGECEEDPTLKEQLQLISESMKEYGLFFVSVDHISCLILVAHISFLILQVRPIHPMHGRRVVGVRQMLAGVRRWDHEQNETGRSTGRVRGYEGRVSAHGGVDCMQHRPLRTGLRGWKLHQLDGMQRTVRTRNSGAHSAAGARGGGRWRVPQAV